MYDYFDLHMTPGEMHTISNLGLAHLGDAVYELMVRARLCTNGQATARELHRATVQLVSAPAQARRAARILPLLTQEEEAVFRRGRNTDPHAVPQSATRAEYQTATALECLFGWLYLQGQRERLGQLFDVLMQDEEDDARAT